MELLASAINYEVTIVYAAIPSLYIPFKNLEKGKRRSPAGRLSAPWAHTSIAPA
jgi:hypothetical protein